MRIRRDDRPALTAKIEEIRSRPGMHQLELPSGDVVHLRVRKGKIYISPSPIPEALPEAPETP